MPSNLTKPFEAGMKNHIRNKYENNVSEQKLEQQIYERRKSSLE